MFSLPEHYMLCYTGKNWKKVDKINIFKQKVKVEEKTARLLNLPIASVVPCPYQPRQIFDMEALGELADSIRRHGVLQPVPVREISGGKYELIAGERRLRASAMAGLTHIPAVLTEYSDKEVAALALVENLQRCDLNFFDEAIGIARLIIENSITQEEAAKLLGKSQPTIANKLRLLKLSEDIRSIINEANLTERHARALLRLPEVKRAEILGKIVSSALNVNETDALVERTLAPPRKPTRVIIKDIKIFFNTVNKALTIMRDSGIDAAADMEELDGYYVYKIKIPKKKEREMTAV